MTRLRSQSNPNPRRCRRPYVYTPLSSPRHIRLIRLLHYDPVLSQLYITLTEHHIDTIAYRFTALSYTWGAAVEPFELPQPDPTSPTTKPSPDTVELIVVPPGSFDTFRRRDDLATTEGALLHTYTPDVRSLRVAGGSNLSDFFRAYLAADFPHRHLRPRKSDGRSLTFEQVSRLWIDAVCIDQRNAAEKAAQIPLMGELYSRAGRVLGWLGAEERRLEAFCWWHQVVFPALGEFVRRSESPADGMMKLREGNFMDEKFWREAVEFAEEPKGGSWVNAWTDYWVFYKTRRYFHRVWIVQEVVVAGRFDIMAGANGEELSWEQMTDFALFLGHAGWIDVLDSLARETLSNDYTDGISRGFGITDIAGMQTRHRTREFEASGWPEHWWAALSSVRRRDCFVKQDKVFATVGMLQQALLAGTPLPFPVDASATPEEVYIHAARTLLLHCPHLTLLSFIEHPSYRSLTQLPSWVPDLTTAKFPWPLGAFDSTFQACILPSTTPPSRVITPSGHLRLRGFKLDTVTVKTEYCGPMNVRLAETVLQFLASLPHNYRHVNLRFQTTGSKISEGQFREAALVHTLTCHEQSNVNRGTATETLRLSASFRDWLLVALGQVYYAGCLLRPEDEGYSAEEVARLEERWREIERVIEGMSVRSLVPDVEELKVHGEAVAKAKRGEGPWPECIVSPQEFKDQVRRVMLYRCLLRTKDDWIGVCSEACEVGDEVWLLEGGAVPYVLRRQKVEGDEVKFVFRGECYIHGAMNGEVVRRDTIQDKLQQVVIE
ncbi:heterokaryon incompatibility protein-domain-containing protein [Corynascus similis CBS 632.67]